MTIHTRQLGKSLVLAFATVALAGTVTMAAAAAEFGTAAEAKSLLTKAVAAVETDKNEALSKFNSGAEGFKDRDLYVFCIGSGGIVTAGPNKGQDAKTLKDKKGKFLGREMLQVAMEGKISEVEYMWPRPGTTEPIAKVSYVTKVDDQVCGVGYYR